MKALVSDKTVNSFQYFTLIDSFCVDVSLRNKMAIVVTTWDGQLNTEVIDLARCQDATADGLTSVLFQTLKDANINPSNMVGFCGDTCNAMFGEHNSVAQKLRLQIPGILTVKCACHSVHLCSSKAFSQLPPQVIDTCTFPTHM